MRIEGSCGSGFQYRDPFSPNEIQDLGISYLYWLCLFPFDFSIFGKLSRRSSDPQGAAFSGIGGTSSVVSATLMGAYTCVTIESSVLWPFPSLASNLLLTVKGATDSSKTGSLASDGAMVGEGGTIASGL